MPEQTSSLPAALSSRSLRLSLAVIASLLGLWLLSPALHPVHVEAFSARSHSLAIMDLQGKLPLDDQAYPVNIEYFFGLRLGTVKALEWIMRLTQSLGDLNFHLLTTASFLLLLGSSFAFVRRWSRIPLWAALAFAILTPGLVEISFFFSDSLPSAALAALAIAFISRHTPLWRWPVIGLLVAAATLCRSDGLFVLPSILVFSLLRDDLRWSRLLRDWLAMSLGIAALFLLGWRATGYSIQHIIRVSSWIGRMHFNGNNGPHLAYLALTLFFGPPSLLLLAAGLRTLWRRQTPRERLLLTIYPVLFYLYFAFKAIEPRNFLLLGAPFLVLIGAAGTQTFVRALLGRSPGRRLIAAALTAACLVLMLLPPRVTLSDGPHAVTGRLWSPILWRQWQSTITEDMTRYNQFVDTIQPGERALVVGASFQAERYLHLNLLERGYVIQPSAATHFGLLADVYICGNKTLLMFRNEQPFAIYTAKHPAMSFEYPQEFQLATELSALTPADFDRAVMITWGDEWFYQGQVSLSPQFRRQAGPMEEIIPSYKYPAHRRGFYGKLRIIPLSLQDLADLKQLSLNQMAFEERSGMFPPLRDYGVLHQVLSCHYCD